MKIVFSDKQKLMTKFASNGVQTKVLNAIGRFGYDVKSIELTVRSAKNRRNGTDQECQILVRLRNLDDVIVSTKDPSLAKAIGVCLTRVERAVARRIERRNNHAARNSRLEFVRE